MSKFFIDAGHGGTDPGAINGNRRESDDNLRLALAVQKLLEAQGHQVRMSRTTDAHGSLAARTTAANTWGADLYISLHRNSFTNSTANGVEVWVYTTAGAVEVAAATEVYDRIVAVAAQSKRGVRKGNYHVCRETNMPAMLVELGFISNAQDNELFDKHFNAYAEAVAMGACAALGQPWNTGGSTGADGTLYRVQVGAFQVKGNADNFVKTVQGMGLDAFLVTVQTPTGTE